MQPFLQSSTYFMPGWMQRIAYCENICCCEGFEVMFLITASVFGQWTRLTAAVRVEIHSVWHLMFVIYGYHFHQLFSSSFRCPARRWVKLDTCLVPTENKIRGNVLHSNSYGHIRKKGVQLQGRVQQPHMCCNATRPRVTGTTQALKILSSIWEYWRLLVKS